jgi:hypothetical protein
VIREREDPERRSTPRIVSFKPITDRAFYGRVLAPIIVDLMIIVISIGALNILSTLIEELSSGTDWRGIHFTLFKLFLLSFILIFLAYNVAAYHSTVATDLGDKVRPGTGRWNKNAFSPAKHLTIFLLDLAQISLTGLFFAFLQTKLDATDKISDLAQSMLRTLKPILLIFLLWHGVRVIWHLMTRGVPQAITSHLAFTGAYWLLLASTFVFQGETTEPEDIVIICWGISCLVATMVFVFYFYHGSLFIKIAKQMQDILKNGRSK